MKFNDKDIKQKLTSTLRFPSTYKKGKQSFTSFPHPLFLSFHRSIDVMSRHNFSVLLSNLLGLIVVLAIETILNILVCTRQSSTPKTAYRRYLRTVFHTLNFYEFLPENDSKYVHVHFISNLH